MQCTFVTRHMPAHATHAKIRTTPGIPSSICTYQPCGEKCVHMQTERCAEETGVVAAHQKRPLHCPSARKSPHTHKQDTQDMSPVLPKMKKRKKVGAAQLGTGRWHGRHLEGVEEAKGKGWGRRWQEKEGTAAGRKQPTCKNTNTQTQTQYHCQIIYNHVLSCHVFKPNRPSTPFLFAQPSLCFRGERHACCCAMFCQVF